MTTLAGPATASHVTVKSSSSVRETAADAPRPVPGIRSTERRRISRSSPEANAAAAVFAHIAPKKQLTRWVPRRGVRGYPAWPGWSS
uniref:Secreted protein n=1 Tax=Steinernema glaseri TaxID=37863 RepID=A0A1I7Y7M4_9BILA